jgi:uncharacterized C2H2 Zn-finger protein
MPAEINVINWCDYCFGDGVKTQGLVTEPIAFGKAMPRTIILCDEHRSTLDQVRELVQRFGEIVEPREKAAKAPKKRASAAADAGEGEREPDLFSEEELTCPACGFVSATPTGLSAHASKSHNSTLPELRGEELPYECPECQKRFSTPQGQGAHRKAAHGVVGASKKTAQRNAAVRVKKS